ncbi:hypothetical protein FRC96_21525 [Lujinxingia vulgaris]|uniref:Lipoprotein n=1 Tax=Lujinxingia vulgaris TaxID=2600176 RepID=A0A5C6WT38_9DELT|nr:hypothetical protein [Lujinxingia vulgaris]TXD31441.1 hypothetical protein FRC96_21525 [Lujinxingia vulgaris]
MSSFLTSLLMVKPVRARSGGFVVAIGFLLIVAACTSTPTPTDDGLTPTENGEVTQAPDDPLYTAQRWLEAKQAAGELPAHYEVVRMLALDEDRLEVIISSFNEPPATEATWLVLARDQEGWEVVEEGSARARRDWPRY